VRVYLEAELGRLRNELESFAGRSISDEDLKKSIRVYNENRELMRELDRVRAADPSFLSAGQMTDLVLASCILPREEHSGLLRSLLKSRPDAGGAGPADAESVSVLLTGVMPRPAAILGMLEEVGVRVVGDDMGMGGLYYSVRVPEDPDPLKALAAGYTGYPACSTLHDGAADRGAALARRARETGAEGVLIFATKFCEPEYFDYPGLKEDLEKAGVPVFLLETELGLGVPGAIRTRVEAFVETLRAKKPSA